MRYVLSQQAADYLVSNEELSFYGTSWKSADFASPCRTRLIHNTIFDAALIVECLDLFKIGENISNLA